MSISGKCYCILAIRPWIQKYPLNDPFLLENRHRLIKDPRANAKMLKLDSETMIGGNLQIGLYVLLAEC